MHRNLLLIIHCIFSTEYNRRESVRVTGKRYKHLLYEDEELEILPKKLTSGKKGAKSSMQKNLQKKSHDKLQRKLRSKKRVKRKVKCIKDRTVSKKEMEDAIIPEAMPIQPYTEFPFTQPYTIDWISKIQESHRIEEDIEQNIREGEELDIEMIVNSSIEKSLSVYEENEVGFSMSVPLLPPLFPIEHEEEFLNGSCFYNKGIEPAINCFHN